MKIDEEFLKINKKGGKEYWIVIVDSHNFYFLSGSLRHENEVIGDAEYLSPCQVTLNHLKNDLDIDLWLATCKASRFEFESDVPIRFHLKVTGRFENLESPHLPHLPSYHKQHSLFNDKFQSFRIATGIYIEFN